jgi:hypothetical protein
LIDVPFIEICHEMKEAANNGPESKYTACDDQEYSPHAAGDCGSGGSFKVREMRIATKDVELLLLLNLQENDAKSNNKMNSEEFCSKKTFRVGPFYFGKPGKRPAPKAIKMTGKICLVTHEALVSTGRRPSAAWRVRENREQR